MTIPGSNIIEQWLDCLRPIFVWGVLKSWELQDEMTEHVTQDGGLRGIGPRPLLQFLVRDGMFYVERQPVTR
jgi:hypothetical protein